MSSLNLEGLLDTDDFIDKATQIAEEGNRNLVFITNDVSNFKYINDFYGMSEGNRFLEEMSRYFFVNNKSCIAACRTGCDQFRGVFDIGDRTVEEEVELIIRMNSEFERIMSERYPNVYIHVYTGIYFLRDTDTDIRMAIDNAHVAKKQIKGKYNIKCQIYSPKETKSQINKMDASNLFLRACERDEIQVYLQPKVSVSQNKVVGAEALVRIVDKEGNVTMPGKFIPVLEETGMIGKLDEIMVEKVFKLLRDWMDNGVPLLPISVNVSRQEFSSEDFAEKVIAHQKKYQVPPEYVEFEILESTFIDAMDYIIDTINILREYGFKISVDDFGSGYSSLNQIATVPADIIKMDRGFINDCLRSEKEQKLIKTLIYLFKDIDYTIVFEGIETEMQRDLLCSFGCDIIQGFLYSKPIPVEEFINKYRVG